MSFGSDIGIGLATQTPRAEQRPRREREVEGPGAIAHPPSSRDTAAKARCRRRSIGVRTPRGRRALRLRFSPAAGQRQAAYPRPAASGKLARRVGLGIAAAWIATVAGCAPDPRSQTRPDIAPIALRFIADDPQILFSDEGLFDEEREFVWKLRFPWDLLWWHLGATDVEFQRSGAPAVFTPRGGSPRLERNAQTDTESVHAIRLVAEGATDDWVLYWKRTAERVSGERHVRAHPRDTDRKEVKTWDFVVASHPRWKKRLLGFRLDPIVQPKQPFQIHSLSGIRFVVNAERLEQTVNRPWKVDLKRDVRNALLVPPGRSAERELTVPEHAELRFAYGFRTGIVPPHTAEPIRFRVAIARAGSEPETLYEGKLDPILTGTAAPRWQERVLDLGPYAGARVRLILGTAANATWEPVHGFPFWANPEVVHRTPRTAASEAGSSDAGGRANVVLISIDTLRADHLSLYGYGRETSPHIDAWARRIGVTFENAIVQAPWTLPSHVSMFTGLEAFHHQANYSPAPPELTMLAEVLRRAGHTTVAVTGGGYVGPTYGFAQGFDRYEYWEGSNAFEMTDGMNRTIKWIEENADRPFFFFFHTFEVHSPFRPREPYASTFGLSERAGNPVKLKSVDQDAADGFRTRRVLAWPDGSTSDGGKLSSAQQASVLSLYDSGIAFADATLERLFTRLGELALERDTLVILTSDHGEAFGEHDLVGHGYLTEDNLRVPLVVAFPRRLATARTLSSQVRSIDIVPTVLELLDLPPLPGIDGVSLVPLMEGVTTPETPGRGRDAWTYAALSNYGMSLRVANRLQYVFNDTPWEPIRGTETFLTVEDGTRMEAAPPEAGTLREQMRATLAERPGLRLRFSNAGPRPYSGVLRGAGLNTARVKTLDMTCPCASWEGGGVRLTVPPGESYTLLLENIEAEPPLSLMVRFDPEAGPAERHRLDLDPATLTEPLTLTFRDGAWTAAGAGPQPATGVRAWWHGAQNILGASGPPSDAQRQQLRALGYIE
jgi:arylsulfatase